MQRHFGVTQLSRHQMVLNFDRARMINRIPGKPGSIRVLIDPNTLPALK
ncbi:MAG: hypothetical protein OXF88_10475 [Rhodobacteraceae bacterium]|nr:hypothetical protein [Paracoccaceae bacterium]MCY4141589.1 hypothetical protein [Paracoccaceae bacterium]